MADDLMTMLRETVEDYRVIRKRHGYLHVSVPRERVMEVIVTAKSRCGKNVLQLISAVDRIERDIFQLTWILESTEDASIFMVSADYPREGCKVPTLKDMWPSAVFFERELREMFGIEFPGNPRQDEDFLLEGWEGIPPMRRDFDTLEYSMKTYGERRKREHVDPRRLIAEHTGEWDTPVPSRKEKS